MKIHLKSNLTCNIYMQHNDKQSDSTTKSIIKGGGGVMQYNIIGIIGVEKLYDL